MKNSLFWIYEDGIYSELPVGTYYIARSNNLDRVKFVARFIRNKDLPHGILPSGYLDSSANLSDGTFFESCSEAQKVCDLHYTSHVVSYLQMKNKKKILITGGPVFANLDAVKIITNKFKGGLMASLAEQLSSAPFYCSVTYLTAKDSKLPEIKDHKQICSEDFKERKIDIVYHNGFDDYRQKVSELSKKHDSTVLGAAVCSLMPMNPWKTKFPSHHYKPGDVVPIDFTIAPRVINEVKNNNPQTILFGFKLWSGCSHEELISAAHEMLLESKATAIFANDTTDSNTIYAVMQDRSSHQINRSELAKTIFTIFNDHNSHVVSE